MKSTVASLAVALFVALPSACAASSHDDSVADAAALRQLEQRAEHAEARERIFLYTELVQGYTQIAGQQMADDDMEHASATLKRIEDFAARIHVGLTKNTRRLKDAEMMMHMASYRLTQCMHAASEEDRPAIASTIRQLEKVHDELLAQVFAH